MFTTTVTPLAKISPLETSSCYRIADLIAAGVIDDSDLEFEEEVETQVLIGMMPHYLVVDEPDVDDSESGRPCPTCGGLYCGQVCFNLVAEVAA